MSETVAIQGHIDESGTFKSLKLKSGLSKELQLDFSQVKSISAGGLRLFQVWLAELGVEQLVLHRCSQGILDQLNSLKAISQLKARVASVELSLKCPHCSSGVDYLAQRGQDYLEGSVVHRESLDLPQEISCPGCGGQVPLESEVSSYFAFLKHRN